MRDNDPTREMNEGQFLQAATRKLRECDLEASKHNAQNPRLSWLHWRDRVHRVRLTVDVAHDRSRFNRIRVPKLTRIEPMNPHQRVFPPFSLR